MSGSAQVSTKKALTTFLPGKLWFSTRATTSARTSSTPMEHAAKYRDLSRLDRGPIVVKAARKFFSPTKVLALGRIRL